MIFKKKNTFLANQFCHYMFRASLGGSINCEIVAENSRDAGAVTSMSSSVSHRRTVISAAHGKKYLDWDLDLWIVHDRAKVLHATNEICGGQMKFQWGLTIFFLFFLINNRSRRILRNFQLVWLWTWRFLTSPFVHQCQRHPWSEQGNKHTAK